MRVVVKYFSALRDATGKIQEEVTVLREPRFLNCLNGSSSLTQRQRRLKRSCWCL